MDTLAVEIVAVKDPSGASPLPRTGPGSLPEVVSFSEMLGITCAGPAIAAVGAGADASLGAFTSPGTADDVVACVRV